jgi:hypothetical protein
MGEPVLPRDVARSSAVDAALRRLDQGLAVLRRLIPIALRTSRLVGVYTALVGVAAATIVVTLVVRFPPSSFAEALGYLVLAALVAAPTAMLWLFHKALAGTVRIPQRLASVPEVARGHGSELAGLLAEAQRRRGGIRLMSLPGDLWRAGKLLLAAHDDLPDYGAALSLVSVPFLIGSLVAAVVGFWQIVLAPAVVAGAVLTAVV